MSKHICHLLLRILFSLMPFSAACAVELTQHLKYNATYFDASNFTPASTTFNSLNYRLNIAEKIESITFESHYQLTSYYSNKHDLVYTNPDSYRLFTLSSTLHESNQQIVHHRLDRFFVGYNTDNTRTKFGRQAITWGNGLVYNVMDIFNPFSPTAIDKEYKVGDDMLLSQLLTDAGNDWQILYLPRRNTDLNISQSESSFATKYHATQSNMDFDILLAKHYDSDIIGAGFSKSLGETLWRLDVTQTRTSDHQKIISFVTNMDYSWISFNKNIYGFIELYHNGFGNKNSLNPANINLNERLLRGEIFTPFKNYFATGISIELHPLVKLSPTIIHEIDNNNTSVILSLNYDLKQNISLKSSVIYHQESDLIPSNNSVDLLLSLFF